MNVQVQRPTRRTLVIFSDTMGNMREISLGSYWILTVNNISLQHRQFHLIQFDFKPKLFNLHSALEGAICNPTDVKEEELDYIDIIASTHGVVVLRRQL